MKDQYFGDINDYRKYGLIRGLTNFGCIRTAVCWMLTPDAEGNVDGRKMSYLGNPKVYRHHDPQLFDLLHSQVLGSDVRCVNTPAMREILPNTQFGDTSVPTEVAAREGWLHDFLAASADADILFFDPDNGMEVPSVRKGTKESPKYLYWDELSAAYAAGHSVLVYQHFQRVQRKEFIVRLSQNAYEVTGAHAIFTYTTPHVVFLLICQKHHLERFLEVNELIARNWHSQIIVSSPYEVSNCSFDDCMPVSGCAFCSMDSARIILRNEHALAIHDRFPVTPDHSLIIPKRHIASFFEATNKEQAAMLDLLVEMRQLLLKEQSPAGFNIGINDGAAAGQTIMHLHIHLIPRYSGDTDDPRGGVRWIIPEKAPYWKKQ